MRVIITILRDLYNVHKHILNITIRYKNTVFQKCLLLNSLEIGGSTPHKTIR